MYRVTTWVCNSLKKCKHTEIHMQDNLAGVWKAAAWDAYYLIQFKLVKLRLRRQKTACMITVVFYNDSRARTAVNKKVGSFQTYCLVADRIHHASAQCSWSVQFFVAVLLLLQITGRNHCISNQLLLFHCTYPNGRSRSIRSIITVLLYLTSRALVLSHVVSVKLIR